MNPFGASNRRRFLMQGGALLASASGVARAGDTRPIVIGHTYPASGIFADTAVEMKAAIDAAALAVNTAGGIGGRAIQVVSLDDAYDPKRSLANAQRLRDEHRAVALVAPLGTPNIDALAPWAERTAVPLIGARSGADAQRAYRRYVFFNIASFGDEVRYIARHLDTIDMRRVAVAAMDNPTGRGIAQLFAEASAAHRLVTAATALFDPAGSNSAATAARILDAKPRAVLLAGGGQGAIEFTRHLLDGGLSASSIYGLSLQQPLHMHRALGARADGMVFSQVMPRLDDHRLALVAQYRAALQRTPGSQPTLFGLEGFLSMQIIVRALSSGAAEPSGASIAATLDRLGAFDVGGFRLQYDGTSHHGTHYVDLGILSRGRVTR